MRNLTEYELDLVAGGTSSSDFYDGGDGSPYQNGGSGWGGGSGGGGTGFWHWVAVWASVQVGNGPPDAGWNGYWTWVPYDSTGSGQGGQGGTSGAPEGPEGIDLEGRDCPTDQAAARSALEILYNNSPTARALIDQAAARGVDLNLIMANNTGQGQQAGYHPSTNTIFWDPFQYVEGTNTDGSPYALTPLMLLAHELVHAAHGDDPSYQTVAAEALVMSIANQIATELNARTGSNYDTSRDSHIRTGLYTTSSITSTVASIARPGCN